MRIPRRYRIAMLAYPTPYRESRGAELMATLAEGDDDRGRPSTHEAGALAYRGLLLRARAAVTPEGLLVAAAVVILVALLGGFTWVERIYLLDGAAAAGGTDGPGRWWGFALALCAFLIVAAGPLRAFEAPQRRRRTLMLAVVFSLAMLTGPGEFFHWALNGPGTLPEFFEWRGRILLNWTQTGETLVAALVGIVFARRILGPRRPAARRMVLGAALVILSATVVVQTWSRPDLPPEYGQSAFADLEAGAFIAGAGLLLAVVASLLGLARRRGWDSNPRGT